MTDKQLAYLLKYFRHRLKGAVKECERKLPEEAFKEYTSMFTSHSFKKAPALDPLKEIISELKTDIEKLENDE